MEWNEAVLVVCGAVILGAVIWSLDNTNPEGSRLVALMIVGLMGALPMLAAVISSLLRRRDEH